jgi:hypothetical protein
MATEFGDGTWIVGSQIEPGVYQSPGLVNSETGQDIRGYWERLSGFTGTSDDILANHNGVGPFVVQILSSDMGFQSKRCGPWKKIS